MTIDELYREYSMSTNPNPGVLTIIQEHNVDILLVSDEENVRTLQRKLTELGFQDLADSLD